MSSLNLHAQDEEAFDTSDRVFLNQIETLINEGVYSEAIRRLELWLRENPEDYEARRLISESYQRTGGAFRLRYHARLLSEEFPGDPTINAWLSDAEAVIETEYPLALEELETALANDPENKLLRRELIELYLLGERKEDAVREFRVLLVEDPENPDLLLEFARNLSWMDMLDESISTYLRYLELVDVQPPIIRIELARNYAWNTEYRKAMAILDDILEEQPDHLDARVLLGDIYRWNDDGMAAGELYDYVIKRDPEHPYALAGIKSLEERASLQYQTGTALTIDDMEARVREDPEDVVAFRQLARLYSNDLRYAEAAEVYERLLRLHPDDTPSRRDYAFCLSNIGEFDTAIGELRRYLEEFPKDMISKLDIVRYLMWSERYDAARRELMELFEYSELYPEIKWMLARLEHSQANWDEAIRYYLMLDESSPYFTVARGYVREIQSNPFYQLELLQARVSQEPEDIESRLDLAVIYLDGRRYWEAREQAEAALRYAPGHVEAQRIIEWSDLGLEEVRYERLREMRARLRENPDDVEAILEIARILRLESNFEDSVRFYRAYLEMIPQDAEVLEEYAMALYWLPGREEIAAVELRRLLDFRPNDIELHLLYLELVARLDELSFDDYETIMALESELDYQILVNPENAQAYFWLGRLYEIRDRESAALELYSYADDLLPSEAVLRSTISDRVDALINTPEHRIRNLEQMAIETPGDSGALTDLAVLHYDLGSFFDARDAASRALVINPNDFTAQDIYYAAERNIEDLRRENMLRLRTTIVEDPRDMDAQLEFARLLRQEGSFDEARERYRLYLKSYPSDLEVRREYAEMLSWTEGHREEAINELRELAELYPHDYQFQLQVARAMSWDRRYWMEAEERLERLSLLVGEDPEILVILADLHRFQGRISEATELYDRVIAVTGHTRGFYSNRYAGYEAVEPYYVRENRRFVVDNEPLPSANSGIYERSRVTRAGTTSPSEETFLYVEPEYNLRRNEVQAVYEDPFLSPLYFRDPEVFESRSNWALPEERSISGSYSRNETTSRMLAADQRSIGTTTQTRVVQNFDSEDFRARSVEPIEGDLNDFRRNQREIIVSTRDAQEREVERWSSGRRANSFESREPRRLAEATSLSRSREDIPSVDRPSLGRSQIVDHSPVSYRRRDIVSDPVLLDGRDRGFARTRAGSADLRSDGRAMRSVDYDLPPGRTYERVVNSREPVHLVEPSSRFDGTYGRDNFRVPQSPRSLAASTRRIDPFNGSARVGTVEPQARGTWIREPLEVPPATPRDYRRSHVYQQEPRVVQGYGDDWLYSQRPYYPASGEVLSGTRTRAYAEAPREEVLVRDQFGRIQPRYYDSRYETAPVRRTYVDPRYDRGSALVQSAPVDPYREVPRESRRYVPASANSYETRGVRRAPQREYLRYPQQRPAGPYTYDRNGNIVPLDSRSSRQIQQQVPADRWRRVSNQDDLVVASSMRNDSRLFAPVETVRRAPARRVVTPAPVTEYRRTRPQVQPLSSVTTYRQFGDSGSGNSRIQPRVTNFATAEGLDYASRAEAGMMSINDQLRPRIGFFYGAEGDSDDFRGQRLGGRYSQFQRNGTRWDIGLTYFRYEEDSGLTVSEAVDAAQLSLGVSAPLLDRLTGSAELKLTNYSIGPDFTLNGGVGATYAVDTVNTISLDYENYDAIHAVKTVRSLEQEIGVDRLTLAWNSNPVSSGMEREFWQRLYFEGNVSFASYSDENTEFSFLARPYLRVLDIPTLDVGLGWRSLSLENESPFYWSPDSYSGPLISGRLAGETFWDMLYEVRAEVFFPSGEGAARSISFDLRKNFTENFTAGANLFVSQSSREDDDSYNYIGLLLDVLYRF